jgi:hypothetical protein
MRVAVDQPRDRRAAAAVDLLHLAVEPPEVGHAPDRRHPPVLAEDVRVFGHGDLRKLTPTQRRALPRR